MKFSKMKQTVATMLVFLGLKSLPIKDGALDFTEDQKAELQKAFGEKISLEKVVTAVNQELSAMQEDASEKDQVLIDARAEIEEELKAHGLSKEDLKEGAKTPEGVSPDAIEGIKTMVSAYVKKTDGILKKLMDKAEVDTPVAVGTQQKTIDMKHSATHLMGSGNQLDAFEKRPWNKLAAGHIKEAPTFAVGSTEVQTLKGDMELYHREVNSDLKSLFRDNLKLPSFWKLRSNVDDRVADGNVVAAEITQARKKGWLPKNQQLIQPEEAQVYPAQIDIEYAGHWLQEQLTSWISQYNKEGSQAYKWTFVKFLNSELDKRRAQEDRVVAIKGVHVNTPDTATIPGLAIHRGDGILIKLWRAFYLDKKYKVAQIGAPTPNNIVDYVKALIDSNIPVEEKNVSGLVLYLSPTWLRAHVERKRVLFGLDNNYTGQELLEIENYPNVKFCPMVDMEGTDFMFVTYDNNIGLMENVPGEASMYHVESLKRDIYVFGDYKWGPRIFHIGTKVKDGDPAEFKVQTVWSNGLNPFKSDFFPRLYDDTTGDIAIPYSNITVTDDWATDIENITNTYEGQIVRVQGNVSATGLVVDTGNITLVSNADWDIASGGVLTLRVGAGGALAEVKRTTTPATTPSADVDFNGTAIDADEGYIFNYTGGAATMTAITNGVEGQQIVINGGAGGTLTIDDVAGNIEVASTAALLNAADNLTLTMVDGVWTEVARTI